MGDDKPPEIGDPSAPSTRSGYPDQDRVTPPMAGPPTFDLIGRSLGEYRIEARIGKGGMGQVFRALHVRLGKLVALKVLPAHRFDDPQAVERFLREMQAVGRLEHPNIVLARDAGKIDGVHFLVMELVEGVDLAALVKRSGPLGVAVACELIRQAALGLQHAHEQGLVHRDLKPSNLMLTAAGVVKVLDLGLALIREGIPADDLTSDGAIMGTTDYMAPEQWTDSHRVDIRADLYSLGCTLYALLVGEPPFRGTTHPTTRAKRLGHLHEPPAPIRRHRDDVPVELAAILDRLLAKSPDDRFATPRELAEALAPMASANAVRSLLGLDPIEPEPRPQPVPAPPRVDRRGPVGEPAMFDDVQFTVHRPRVLVPTLWHPMLVFAHLSKKPAGAPADAPDPIEEVRRQAEAVLGPRRVAEYQQSTQESTRDVPQEGLLTIVPDAAGIEFNPTRRSFRWEEWVHCEEFRLRAPADLDGRTIKGRVSVYLDSILIAEVALRFRVESGHEPPADAPMERDSARMFRRIFASFAPADRPVADQFERFARAMGDEYLSSCTALRAGDAWDDRLRELIDRADVFQLFWSSNALRSPMVEREWRHALSLGRPSFIRPVYWEDPLPADPARGLPPDDLRRLYFQRLDGFDPPPRTDGPGPPPGLDGPGPPGKPMKPSPGDRLEIEPREALPLNATEVDELADRFGRLLAGSPGRAIRATDGDESARPPARGLSGKIEPSMTLYGKYQVIKKLGGGAMGDVWLVRHTSLGDLHALKVIVSNIASNEIALRRFQRDFKVMASLKHPHAVQIYDAVIDGDGGYIDMEYVQGQTIHDLLVAARKRPDLDPSVPLMPLDSIVKVLDQLTEVLQEAHDKGLVHRDLKPGNLMLLDGRKPGKESLKVLDFGIAKIRDDPDNAANQTLTQGFIGTPSYGSPEQAMNRQDIDGRADIYSVGVMLYEFVTGRLPFKGVHFQVMHQHATMPPPPFHEANPKLRPLPELERAILRALSKDREHRQQTARDLFDEIAWAIEDIQGPSAGPLPSTWSTPRSLAPTGATTSEHGTKHDGGSLLASGGPDTVSTPVTEPDEQKAADRSSWPDKEVVRPTRRRRMVMAVLVFVLLASTVVGVGLRSGMLDRWLNLLLR